MSHEHPRIAAESYRWQVHTIENVKCAHCGVSREEPGELLWEEPAGREIEWVVSARVASAKDHAQRLADERSQRVSLSSKNLYTDELAESQTVVHPTPMAVPR